MSPPPGAPDAPDKPEHADPPDRPPFDEHDLYELCVQSVADLEPLLRAVHGQSPKALGEDFAGTAALSRAWVARDPDSTAIAVDLDARPLSRAASTDRLSVRHADVREVFDEVDLVFCGNFSIGYVRKRHNLVEYLRHARSRLNDGGVFVCDTYGGESAFIVGRLERDHPIPEGSPIPGTHVHYVWEQRHADPLTGHVTDVLHFRVFDADEATHDFPEAFVYEWRLWSVPELRDAMLEAGYRAVEVYGQLPDAKDDDGNVFVEPVSGEDLDESFIVCVAARA